MKTMNGAIIIEGHVQGLSNTRSLGEKGIPVYVIDKGSCLAMHSKYCQKYFKCPNYKDDEFADFLVELAESEGIKDWVLFPSNDHAVATISKHKKRLDQYYKTNVPEPEVLNKIYDKAELIRIAKKIGIAVPETENFLFANQLFQNRLRFPVLTKGRNGLTFYKTTSRKAFIAHDQDQLREQLKKISKKLHLGNTFTQEYIPFDGTNNTISFTAFCIEGQVKSHWMGYKLREHPHRFGTGTFTKSTFVEECLELSSKLISELNYTGVCEIEYIKDPRTNLYNLIEMNPRTWLWVGHAKACGIDYANMVYRYFSNLANVYPQSYDTSVKWTHLLTDMIYNTIGLVKQRYSLSQLIETYKGKVTFGVYNQFDNKPFFIELATFPYIFLKRVLYPDSREVSFKYLYGKMLSVFSAKPASRVTQEHFTL